MARKATKWVLFFTVFIDLIGFGLVIPLLPFFSRYFGASAFQVGALSSIFSLMQFIFSPFWGRLSDRIGRRPVLLISLMGTTLSYLALGFCTGFWQVFGTRVLAGFFGANIAVAQAYIADVTPPEKRSQGMGLIGMAFGLGFVLGPAIGFMFSWFATSYLGFPMEKVYGFIGWTAGTICGVNLLIAWFNLPESRTHIGAIPAEDPQPKKGYFTDWSRAFSLPGVSFLILLYFCLTFAFANFENLFALWIQFKFQYGLKEGNGLFLYIGLIFALVQGGLIGRLVKMYGERKLILGASILFGTSLVLLAWMNSLTGLLVVLAGLGMGMGLNRSSVLGLISQSCPAEHQGSVMGVAQSTSSLGRILGPLAGGLMFDTTHKEIAFISVGALVLVITLMGGSTLLAKPK